MPVSQNGFLANDVNLTSSRLVPGTTRKLRVRKGPAGDLLLWVASQFDKLVEDIEQGILDDWGYAERPIRGGVTLSNHSSGTAVDLNATSHPLGTAPAANFTPGEIAAIRSIIDQTEGCVRWGGEYTGRKDGMHFEIVAPESRCAVVYARLSSVPPGGGGAPGSGGWTPPTLTKEMDYMQTYRIEPRDSGEHSSRVFLPGGPNAKIIVRPAKEGDTEHPVYIGHIFAWGSNKQGVGGDPAAAPGHNPRTVNSREFALPGALWADINWSSANPFIIETTG